MSAISDVTYHSSRGTTKTSEWHALLRNPSFAIGGALVVIVLLPVILAPWISPYDPLAQQPMIRLAAPTLDHPFGTDYLGRDVLSRIIWGGRSTLTITTTAIAVSALIGVILGIISAYTGGLVGRAIDWVSDLLLVFPTLILSLALVVAVGQGFNNIIAAMTIAFVPRFIRLARGSALSLKNECYVEASRAIGGTHRHIIFRHILPNCSSELLVMGTLWLGAGVEIEASLGFLGLGIAEPSPSWGLMVKSGLSYLLVNPLLSIFPSIAIFTTVLGVNLLGDALRDKLDPALRNI